MILLVGMWVGTSSSAFNDSRFRLLRKTTTGRNLSFETQYKTKSVTVCADRCVVLGDQCYGFRYSSICGCCDILTRSDVGKLRAGKNYALIYVSTQYPWFTDIAQGEFTAF